MLLRRLILTVYVFPVFGGRGRSGGYGGSSQRVSYPSGHGLSGTSRGYPYGQGTSYNRGYPSSNRAGYPPSGGLSGNGNTRTEIHHHHHHYSPPQHISYGSTYHPVYHGTPPVYVYQYRNSGSRFDTLLTGLALYNLGRMSAHQDSYRRYGSEYRSSPGEMCKLAISRRNGEYEETRVDCRLMSSFIWDAERESKTVSTHTVVSQTVINNGTTVQNTTVVDALQVKGPSLQVTPGMDCFMIRISRDTSQLRRRVDCALLQEYAIRSYNNCDNLKSLPLVLLCCIVFLFSNK
ncbi:uncharacterized protein LOC121735645 [Aricia agestis]|uniref:uncharacterized protein LOC121735645 n=1 Tax=Aricia agestis TaxID=91739 RepID=UPI001C20B265|nr:uncharacterized protein LOC121735645 [Aricia agestis]